jgi:acyl carrier protein
MSLHEQLQALFREVFDDPGLELRDDTTAADVPNWDSLAHINLMTAIETQFSIHFSDRELGGFADVGELERVLERKIASGAA